MKQEYITHSLEETHALGRELAASFHAGEIVALAGDLGAGKTALAQGILSYFGAEQPYMSPTFVIMKQYDIENAARADISRIYHADAYRVDAEKMLSIGWEEWLDDKQGIVIVEWPERIQNIIPEHATRISLQWLDEKSRSITIERR